MVSSKDGYPVGVPDLQSYQQGDSLNTIVASVYIIAHEKIIGVGQLATQSEELLEVMELSVNVSADGHRSLDRLHVALFHKDLFRLSTQLLDLLLGYWLATQQGIDQLILLLNLKQIRHFKI